MGHRPLEQIQKDLREAQTERKRVLDRVEQLQQEMLALAKAAAEAAEQ